METSAVLYKINNAATIDIIEHLIKCKNNFNPPLDQTVDIGMYAAKLVDNAINFEAWNGNELIGLIAAYFNDTVKGVGFITNVSCLSAFSGKGIASRLLKDCIAYGKSKNFERIELEVNKQSSPAIKLYEKFNFRIREEKDGSLKMEYTF